LLLPRGRRSRRKFLLSHTQLSPSGQSGSLIEEVDEGGGESPGQVAGIGWDWTLDNEDPQPSSQNLLRPDDLLLGWRWTSSQSSGEGDRDLSKAEEETWYEDALSHWQPSHIGGSALLVDQVEPAKPPKSDEVQLVMPKNHLSGKADFAIHLHPPQPRTFRPSSPSRRCQREIRLLPSRRRSVTGSPPPQAPSSVMLPFRTLLQAIFAIDKTTLDLIDHAHETQGTTLFALPEDIVKLDSNSGAEDSSRGPSVQLGIESPESASAADRILMKGFAATHLIPKNPFALPLLLLELGWEYGKGMIVFGRSR